MEFRKMINIRAFLKGALILNILALPLYILSFFMMVPAYPTPETSLDVTSRITSILGFMIGPQILGLLGVFLFAKLWDLMMFKVKQLSKMMTKSATFFGIIVSTILASLYGNFIMDNLFQVKQGNYLYVLSWGLIPLAYYFFCFVVGRLVENLFQKR